ncbi:hypothetical protein [Nocardia cyriacigeorgica]|uniref:hypothetical protein n=1 Tax=Nocardia cyriacigeorgica TaxID=135487 RepID=UPI0013D8A3BD|nr:hypothetical protein [Nocardia cyriacigeorgica]
MTISDPTPSRKPAVNPVVAEAAARNRKRRRVRKTNTPEQLALIDLPARSSHHDHDQRQDRS